MIGLACSGTAGNISHQVEALNDTDQVAFHTRFTQAQISSLITMAPNMSLFAVTAVLILAADDGARVLAKYYTPPHAAASHSGFAPINPYSSLKDQKAFEKGLLEKTAKQTSDIILYDNRVVVFKLESDVMIYVVGDAGENEIMLYNVVLALRDSLNILLKYATRLMLMS